MSRRFSSLKDPSSEQDQASSALVETTAQSVDLTLKQRAGKAANSWLARNRSLVLRQTPFWAQGLVAILISLGSVAVVGSIVLRIDEVVTVQGQLQSIGGTVEVKTPAGGRVAEVLFRDGDNVRKGQKLLRFDTRSALEQKNTLTRLIALEQKQLATQLKTLTSQRATLMSRREVFQQRMRTKSTMLEAMQTLVDQGGFQRLQYLEQQDQLFALQKQVSELTEEESQLQLQAEQLRLQSSKSIDQMRNQLKEAEVQLEYQNVLAPSSGVVFDPKVRVDGVLQPGERILSIVPQQGLYAEVFVPNQDIGFIKPGQQAKVRVDAFPFTRYGELPGQVSQIAEDALPPDQTRNFYRFPVKLKLERPYLESDGVRIPLKAGMAVTTNLKLRDKRVISLVSDLLVDQTDSVRRIRQQ
jgi:hemolysin D